MVTAEAVKDVDPFPFRNDTSIAEKDLLVEYVAMA